MKRGKISWYMARQMWRNGKDTAFIAEHFGKDEAFIYNGLLAHNAGLDHTGGIASPTPNFNIVRHARVS